MNPKLYAQGALILALMGVGYTISHFVAVIPLELEISRQKAAIAQFDATAAKLELDAKDRIAAALSKGATQREQDRQRIAYLTAHPAGRVLLPSTCAGSDNVPEATGSGLQTPIGDRADRSPQQSFDNFTTGATSDAVEWSEALSVCQRLQDYVRALP